jgi:hypothetical protein
LELGELRGSGEGGDRVEHRRARIVRLESSEHRSEQRVAVAAHDVDATTDGDQC